MGIPIQDIKPREELKRILRKWYLLALLGMLGGLAGLGISALLPAQYEARAILQITIFLPEGKFYTDAQTDYALDSAIQMVYSTQMIGQLVTSFQERGEEIEVEDFTLERRESYWDLVVRSREADVAAEAANDWLEESLARLEAADAHSLEASKLATQIEVLNGCTLDPSHPVCSSFANEEELADLAEALWQRYQQEVTDAQGLNPSIHWLVESRAPVPIKPVSHQRGTLMLAGAGIGLLLGMVILQIFNSKHNN